MRELPNTPCCVGGAGWGHQSSMLTSFRDANRMSCSYLRSTDWRQQTGTPPPPTRLATQLRFTLRSICMRIIRWLYAIWRQHICMHICINICDDSNLFQCTEYLSAITNRYHALISILFLSLWLIYSVDLLLGYFTTLFKLHTSVYPKVSGLSHNEINNNNKHSLRSNTKGYGCKTR
jgi:hypothetical protein